MCGAVLVVDDDSAIADMIVRLLEGELIPAKAVCSGKEALDALKRQGSGDYGLVILDIMMPDMDGYETCRRIRETSSVPILFLSARGEEESKVVGFAVGADDYVEKPFKAREFVARVKAHLRRGERPADSDVVMRGSLSLDSRLHKAVVHGVELSLTPKEFAVFELLMEADGAPVSSRELFESCWGERFDDSAANTVMVHIRRLRKKIAAIDSSASPIETVWGVGYKIEKGLR